MSAKKKNPEELKKQLGIAQLLTKTNEVANKIKANAASAGIALPTGQNTAKVGGNKATLAAQKIAAIPKSYKDFTNAADYLADLDRAAGGVATSDQIKATMDQLRKEQGLYLNDAQRGIDGFINSPIPKTIGNAFGMGGITRLADQARGLADTDNPYQTYYDDLSAAYSQRKEQERQAALATYANLRNNADYASVINEALKKDQPQYSIDPKMYATGAALPADNPFAMFSYNVAQEQEAARQFQAGVQNPALWAAQNADELLKADAAYGGRFLGMTDERANYLYMTDDEMKAYTYLMETQGGAAAGEYYNLLSDDLSQRRLNTRYQSQAQWAKEHPWAASALSLATSPLQGVSYIAGLGQRVTTGDIDINSSWMAPAQLTQSLREGATSNVYNKYSALEQEILSKEMSGQKVSEDEYARRDKLRSRADTLNFLANTGFSVADSAISILAGGGGAGTMALMGGEAAGSTMYSSLRSGKTADQALLDGGVSAMIEAATEKIPLDNLKALSAANGSITKGGIKKFLWLAMANAPKQGVTEGVEETISEYANTLYDIIRYGDQSEYNKYYRDLLEDDVDADEAEELTAYEFFVNRPAQSGAGGFVSGLFFGTAGSAVSTYNNARIRNQGNLAAATEASARDTAASMLNMTEAQRAAADTLAEISQRDNAGQSTIADVVASKILTGTNPTNSEIRKLRDASGPVQKAFETMTGIKLTGVDSSTLRAAIGAAAKNPAVDMGLAGQYFGVVNELAARMPADSPAATQYDNLTYNSPDASAIGSIDAARQGGAPLDVASAPDTGRAADMEGDIRFSARRGGSVDNDGNEGYNQINHTNGGINNGRTESDSDSGILAERGVSASGRGRNGVREQSENSRALAEYLGHPEKSNDLTAGFSGFLEIGTEKSVQGSRRNRLLRSVIGKLSARPLRNTDTVGRRLSASLQKKFENTAIKTEDGFILSVYHWTNAVFDVFSRGDIGFHFGAFESARKISRSKNQIKSNGIFKECFLNIKNPILIENDPGTWETRFVAMELFGMGVLNDFEYKYLLGLDGAADGQYGCKAVTALHKLLESKGYDGIIYTNEFEGGYSVIAFHPDQIITVAENGVLKPDCGVTMPGNSADGDISGAQRYGERTTDNLGSELSTEQAEYFKDSKIRDENGNLLRMSHGSRSQFTVFDRSKSNFGMLGFGMYFSSDRSGAAQYTNASKSGRVYDCYLNITNPCDANASLDARKWRKVCSELGVDSSVLDSLKENATNMNAISAIREEMGRRLNGHFAAGADQRWADALKSAGWDGVMNRDRNGSLTVAALEPNQIKRTDNRNPTDNADIRFRAARDSEVDSSYADYDEPITTEDIEVLRSIGRKSINDFSAEDTKKSQKWAHRFWQQLGTKSPFFRAWFGDWRAHDTSPVEVVDIPQYTPTNEARKKLRATYFCKDTNNDGVKWGIRVSRDGETNTISHAGGDRLSEFGLANIGGLIENAILLDSEVHEHHSNNATNDFIAFDHKLYAFGSSEKAGIALYKITVEEYFQSKSEPQNKRFHNLKFIEKIADNVGGRTSEKSRSGGSTSDISTINYTVADLFAFVKKYDSEFQSNDVSPVLLNEDGTPKVFHHGTRKGGFTAFREWSYWTENEKYARRYTNQSTGETVYDAYITADKVFDTRDPECRRIFEEEYSGNYSNTPLQESGLPDWTDGYDLAEFLEENGYNFDMILLDEGGDPTDNGVVERGISYVVKSSSQIKSATDNIGTFDRESDDIRFRLAGNQYDAPELEDALKEDALNDAQLANLTGQLRDHGIDLSDDPDTQELLEAVDMLDNMEPGFKLNITERPYKTAEQKAAEQKAAEKAAVDRAERKRQREEDARRKAEEAEKKKAAIAERRAAQEKKKAAQEKKKAKAEAEAAKNRIQREIVKAAKDNISGTMRIKGSGKDAYSVNIVDIKSMVRSLSGDARAEVMKQLETINQLGKAFGHTVRYFSGKMSGVDATPAGFYHDGTIYANVNYLRAAGVKTVAHEICHDIAASEPSFVSTFYKLYREYCESNGLMSEFNRRWDEVYNNALYPNKQLAIAEEVLAEMFGEYAENDSDFLNYCMGKRPGIVARIVEAFNRLLTKLHLKQYSKAAQDAMELRNYMLGVMAQHQLRRTDRSVRLSSAVRSDYAAAQRKADAIGDRYAVRGDAGVHLAQWDTTGLASPKDYKNLRRTAPNEVTDYGFWKVLVGGEPRNVLIVNPFRYITEGYHADMVASSRSLAAALGIRLGFITGQTTQTVGEGRKRRDITIDADYLLTNDGTLFINLDSEVPYNKIVAGAWWSQYRKKHPQSARNMERLVERVNKLRGGTDTIAQNAAVDMLAGKAVAKGVRAINMDVDSLVKALADNKSAAYAYAHENPGIMRRLFENAGDMVAKLTKKQDYRAAYLGGQLQARLMKAFSESSHDPSRRGGERIESDGRRKAPEGVRFMSVKKDADGQTYVEVEGVNSLDESNVAKILAAIIKDKFNNLITVHGQSIRINQATNREWRESGSARKLRDANPVAYKDKLVSLNNADELIAAVKEYVGEGKTHSRNPKIAEFARGPVRFKVGSRAYLADVLVATTVFDRSALLYDLVNIEEIKITDPPLTSSGKAVADREEESVDTTISQTPSDVKFSAHRNNTTALRNPTRSERRSWLDDYADTYGQISTRFERFARDAVTGERYKAPGDMAFKEWKKKQEEIYGEGIVDLEQKKRYNLNKDTAQWERYKELLGENAPVSIEDFQNIRYGKDWNAFKAYSKSIKSGELTPLADFNLYQSKNNEIDCLLVGAVTQNGLIVTGKSNHFIARTIGSAEQRRNGVDVPEALDAITHPEKVEPIRMNENGKSQRFIGKTAAVTINPETGTLIQSNPIHKRKKEATS